MKHLIDQNQNLIYLYNHNLYEMDDENTPANLLIEEFSLSSSKLNVCMLALLPVFY